MQNLITPAEILRLRRAVQQVRDYSFERVAGTNTYLVSRDGASYRTGENVCTCPDCDETPGRACKHQWMIRAKLDLDGRLSAQQRSVQARADRALWG